MRFAVSLHERIFSVTDRSTGHARRANNAKRGLVSGLSSKSRLRLIRFLAQVSRPDEPVFVTLTYRDFTEESASWKRDLDAWCKRLCAHFPSCCAVWRLQFQRRGAPHYHLLIWLGDSGDREGLRDMFARWWLRIINQDTPENWRYGVDLEVVTDFRKCAFYISLYASSGEQDRTDILTGREWGCVRPGRLGLAPVVQTNLSVGGVLLLRRVLRRSYLSFMRQRNRKVTSGYLRALRGGQGFTNFLPFAQSYRLVQWCRENGDALFDASRERAAASCAVERTVAHT